MSRLRWWAWPFWDHSLPRPSGYQLCPEKVLPQGGKCLTCSVRKGLVGDGVGAELIRAECGSH